MSDTTYDLVVIGAGPGGYVAAIRAAQLGWKTACVEKNATLGGTCLNVGCIPSKALLESSELYAEVKKGIGRHGIKVGSVELDLAGMMKRKDQVVKALTGGIAALFKKNGVDPYFGMGHIGGSGTVIVTDEDGKEQSLSTKYILIATGSSPTSLPGVTLDGDKVVTSTEALAFDAVPEEMIVIGAGVIGLELGSVWNRLGSKVTVVEYADRILPGVDAEIAESARRSFAKQGLKFLVGCRVQETEIKGDKVQVHYLDGDANAQTLEADKVLVSVGRKPHTDKLRAEEAGLKLDARGRIEVDDHYFTGIDGIYAIGDVIRGPMLAHKAEEEGIACVEQLATGYGHINYDAIPNVIYTWPEIASVGKSEEELKEAGIAYKSGSFPFVANGRARALGHTDGMVKFLADETTDQILGCHIVGPRAGDLIAEISLAVEFGGSTEDIARSVHAHPTLAEVVKEAALAVDGRALHI